MDTFRHFLMLGNSSSSLKSPHKRCHSRVCYPRQNSGRIRPRCHACSSWAFFAPCFVFSGVVDVVVDSTNVSSIHKITLWKVGIARYTYSCLTCHWSLTPGRMCLILMLKWIGFPCCEAWRKKSRREKSKWRQDRESHVDRWLETEVMSPSLYLQNLGLRHSGERQIKEQIWLKQNTELEYAGNTFCELFGMEFFECSGRC